MIIAALFAALAVVSPAKKPAHNWITPTARPGESLDVKGYYDGNTLLDLCRRDDNLCIAYVVGATDGQLSAASSGTSRTRAPIASRPTPPRDSSRTSWSSS